MAAEYVAHMLFMIRPFRPTVLASADQEFRPDIQCVSMLRSASRCRFVGNAVETPEENLALCTPVLG
jgi:hypothetical protein